MACERRGLDNADQFDHEQLRFVGQGNTRGAVVRKVKTAVRGEGIDGESRYAHRGVVRQRQLANSPIL